MLVLDRYEVTARMSPALIATLPFFSFYHFYINPEFSGLVHSAFDLKILSEIPISVAIFIGVYHINRLFGKILESVYFRSERSLPTTEYLLYQNDEYSTEYKEGIRERLSQDFKRNLLNPQEEKENNREARREIIEVVRLLRNKVKGGRLVLNRNIEYGFFRNLSVSCFVIFPFSLYGIYFFTKIYPSPMAVNVQIASAILSLLMILTSYFILRFLGKNYANALYQEYMQN